MAEALSAESSIAARLVADLAVVESGDEAWIRHALICFPLPTVRQAPYLFASFMRIAGAVSWAGELLPDQFLVPLQRLGPQIERLVGEKPAVYGLASEAGLSTAFRGDFRLAGTLHAAYSGIPLPGGLEALRVILVWCRWIWSNSGNSRSSVTDDIASAIRGAGHTSIEQLTLLKIGQAKTLAEFMEAASALKTSRHETLAQAWRTHVGPELLGVGRPAPAPKPPPADATPPPPIKVELGPTPVHGEQLGHGEEEPTEPVLGPVRVATPPRPNGAPEPLQGELASEVAPSILTSPLPLAPAHPDARAVLRYQVQQAIWSTNRFLLPDHPDALSLAEYVDVVAGILAILNGPVQSEGLHFGAVALLVVALTGRTPKTLTALEVLEDRSSTHDPHRVDLLLAEGVLRQSVFWQVARGDSEPSYFKPELEQQRHLEAVRQDFLLPLAPTFLDLIKANADRLRTLSKTPVEDIQRCLRIAAGRIQEMQGSTFTVGQLRSSFAVHLFEDVRDTAAVQLLSADTIGDSVAPLSYFAPKAQALAATHWALQNRLLGTEFPMPRYPLGDERVGSHLLTCADSVTAMARASTKILRTGVARLLAEGREVDLHRAMVNQIAGMLMAVATHRPTEALLELTLADVWIDGETGAALLRDKVHDAAHDPRLVALPATICRQIEAYLSHLKGLADRAPSLAAHVRKVLQGNAPLLFELSTQRSTVALNLEGLKLGMPDVWRELPMNWGRHWLRTYAIERGIQPELVSTQLGHLDAVGYPFSRSSPTEPWLFVQEVGREWEALAHAQGWQVVSGIPTTKAVLPDTLTPLRSWGRFIKNHELGQREVAKLWREALKARLRACRENAELEVLAHPALVSAGITERFHERRRGLERHALKRADFERIRDEVFESAEGDLALGLARANAVCRIARTVNGRTRQTSETPGKIMHLRRPLDNAFVPGMMEAVRQVSALRDHVASLAGQSTKERWTDMASACAHTVLAMALFGNHDQFDQILGALERRAQLARSARMPDVVLVPCGDAHHQVIALRGVAAIVFARLAWKFRDEPVPTRDEIEKRLSGLLPSWAIGTPSGERNGATGLLELLCETVAVANRYELSPAARRANASRQGSTPAHLREQLAFIDGDPSGTIHRNWETQTDVAGRNAFAQEAGARLSNARSQYLKLCATFPHVAKDTELLITKTRIPSGEAATLASYAKVATEVDAQIHAEDAAHRLHPIVKMLAAWTSDMLRNGTPLKESPALSTVKTYLTRIGGVLVHFFAQSSMTHVDDVEWEEAYLCAIESANESRSKVAAAAISFHQFVTKHFGLPDIDLSAVHLHLADDPEAVADARLVLPYERTAILDCLARAAHPDGQSISHAEVRTIRQAGLAMPLFAFGGMRRGEALGLQFRDISVREDRLRVSIRPNRSRRLKTVNARRVVGVPTSAMKLQDRTLLEWVTIERGRLGARRLETAFVFAESDAPFDAKARTGIAEACMQACRDITGRRSSRLHAFRHLVAMERATPAFLTEDDLTSLSTRTAMSRLETPRSAVVLPRDLHARVIDLGHGDAATTLACYHHLPWLLRSRTDAWLTGRYVNRAILAPLLGVTLHALDWAVKQRPGRAKGLAWLDVALESRLVPSFSVSVPQSFVDAHRPDSQRLQGRWTARGLGDLLTEVERIGSLEDALFVKGAEPRDAAVLRLGFLAMGRRIGRRLVGEDEVQTSKHPRRLVRRVKAAHSLEALWDWYDSDKDGTRKQIALLADEIHEYMEPRHGDRIYLTAHGGVKLQHLLSSVGVAAAQIVREAGPDGLDVVRILRDAREGEAESERKLVERYLGLTLKRILLVIRFLARHS